MNNPELQRRKSNSFRGDLQGIPFEYLIRKVELREKIHLTTFPFVFKVETPLNPEMFSIHDAVKENRAAGIKTAKLLKLARKKSFLTRHFLVGIFRFRRLGRFKDTNSARILGFFHGNDFIVLLDNFAIGRARRISL